MSQSFLGFPRPRANHFPMPTIWIDICAYIDNLAELKVVQYVLRHTWAASEYDVLRRITVNEFMFGIVDPQTHERIDSGTGLSEQSVRNGLKKAQEHGFLVCEEDRSHLSDIKKTYRLNLYGEVKSLDPQSVEVQTLDLGAGVKSLDPQSVEVKTLDLPASSKQGEEEVQTLDRTRRTYSDIRERHSKTRIPLWLKSFADDFSREFHDDLHIGPNMKQMHTLYRQSGLNEESFIALLYTARDTTRKASIRKKNLTGQPNRMPYFFRCLRSLLEDQHLPASNG